MNKFFPPYIFFHPWKSIEQGNRTMKEKGTAFKDNESKIVNVYFFKGVGKENYLI